MNIYFFRFFLFPVKHCCFNYQFLNKEGKGFIYVFFTRKIQNDFFFINFYFLLVLGDRSCFFTFPLFFNFFKFSFFAFSLFKFIFCFFFVAVFQFLETEQQIKKQKNEED
jgi:hypothetical protein